MEHLEAIFEWSSMNGMGLDEADFMAQLLGNCTSFPNDSFNFPTFYASSDHDQSAMYTTSDETNEASMSCYSFLQGDSVTYPFWPSTDEGDNSTRMDISCTMEVDDNTMKLVGPTQELPRDVVQSECKKRSRVPAKNIVHRSNKRSMKKLKKCTSIIEENSSSCCTEEDDSNASASASCSIGTLNSNGKIRAGRGSATDPQSLYARKRREKISERLRILQKLVPNGTKVDISTMLEEAVDYVKFLQLQIKLLSSDDLWMYAPIAYNGMELGLDLKMAKYMCS